MEVNYLGTCYYIDREDFEPDKIFNERAWFVAKLFPKWEGTYNRLVQFSKIWANSKYIQFKATQHTRYYVIAFTQPF